MHVLSRTELGYGCRLLLVRAGLWYEEGSVMINIKGEEQSACVQGHYEGPLRSNGLISMPLTGQEQMLLPMYAYALHGMAYPVPLQPGSLHMRFHPTSVPTFGPTLSLPNGRIYQQQPPILPASAGGNSPAHSGQLCAFKL